MVTWVCQVKDTVVTGVCQVTDTVVTGVCQVTDTVVTGVCQVTDTVVTVLSSYRYSGHCTVRLQIQWSLGSVRLQI